MGQGQRSNYKRNAKILTKQLHAISPSDAHQLFLTACQWVIWVIWRDIVYFAVGRRPGVFLLVVHLEHGRWDAQEGLHALFCSRS